MTRRLSLKLFVLPVLLAVITGAGWSSPAWAIGLDAAKSQGLVGEQANGYLGVVKSGAGVDALVQDINTKRKAEYQAIAKRNNTTLGAVEALAGKKAIERTPAGQYVRTNGGWVKK